MHRPMTARAASESEVGSGIALEFGAKVDRGEMKSCAFDTTVPAIAVKFALHPDRDAVVAPARPQLR